MLEKINSVVREVFEFQCRDKSMFKTHFTFWDQQGFDAKNKLNDLENKLFSPSVGFSKESLIQEIKPVNCERNEFEYKKKQSY